MLRFRDEIPEVVEAIDRTYRDWKPNRVIVEDNGIGKGVAQYVGRRGINVVGLFKDSDKVVNSTNAILQMKAGRIWLPQDYHEWKKELMDEVFTWQGHPHETDDIVDTLAQAANEVNWEQAGDTEAYEAPEMVDPKSMPIAVQDKHLFSTMGHLY